MSHANGGNIRRRLAVLERRSPGGVELRAVALDMQEGDLALVGRSWVLCPDDCVLLARASGPVKVYVGFDPREVV
jgi:hypothetical protein